MNIPKLLYPQYQDYILHFDGCFYAEIITNSIKEALDFCNACNRTIVKVNAERNFYGLNDYRIFVKEE